MDIKTVEYLASLARLEIDTQEKEALVKDLGGVLAYVDQIRAVAENLDNQAPKYLQSNIASNDEPQHASGQFTENILNQAPNREGQYVVVKKVL